MKKLFKPMLVFILVLALCAAPYGSPAVYAGDDVLTPYEQAEEAGFFVSELLGLIYERYVGSDVSMQELMDAAIRGVMSALDPYSEYLSVREFAEFLSYVNSSYTGIGITLIKKDDGNVYAESVSEGSSADKAGIKAGDMLYRINDTYVTGWDYETIQNLMSTFEDSEFKITVTRDYVPKEFTVKREYIVRRTIYWSELKDVHKSDADMSGIGYVYVSTIGDTTGDEFREAVAGLKAKGIKTVILDLRGNSGGYVDVALDICEQVVPKGNIISVKEKNKPAATYSSSLEKPPFDKIYVMINGHTASAAEIIASALQDSGSIVVGERSYGKGVIQTLYDLPDGSCIKLTTGEYYRRNGGKINIVGITPNIPALDESDENGCDICVEAAIEDIRKE